MQRRPQSRLRLRPPNLHQQQTYLRHSSWNLLHHLLPSLDEYLCDCSNGGQTRGIASQQGAMYRHRWEVLRGNRGVSQVCPDRNQGRLKRRIFDLHRGGVLNGKKPNPAGLHQLFNGWIADCPHPEDCVRLPFEECLGRVRVVCADKTEIRRLETKMFHHAEKGLILPSALYQRDPLAS